MLSFIAFYIHIYYFTYLYVHKNDMLMFTKFTFLFLELWENWEPWKNKRQIIVCINILWQWNVYWYLMWDIASVYSKLAVFLVENFPGQRFLAEPLWRCTSHYEHWLSKWRRRLDLVKSENVKSLIFAFAKLKNVCFSQKEDYACFLQCSCATFSPCSITLSTYIGDVSFVLSET